MNHVRDLVDAMGRPSAADYPSGARMGPRVIADFEFVWMLRGRARFVTSADEVLLTGDRLVLVPPGLRHSFAWDDRGSSRHGYVHFGRGHLPHEETSPRWRSMTPRDPMSGLCAYLLWLGSERPPGWEDHARGTLRFLCTTFTSETLPSDVHLPEMSRCISAAAEFLRREWSAMPLRRVGVAELATAATVSRSYLNRAFRAELGIGVASALERLRCSRAEALLLRTDMTIGSIARQCGFADLYHFSHRFRHVHGTPPRAYRDEGEGASALDHDGVRRLASAVWGVNAASRRWPRTA